MTQKIRKKCILFTKSLNDGYGYIWINGKHVKVSRIIYSIFFGKIHKGKMVLHKCDNRACINPKHLYLGTAKDNMRDCMNHGYFNPPYGERCSKAKLKSYQVLEIRKRLSGGESPLSISKSYNVNRGCIYQIKNKKRWGHLK